MWRKTRQPHHPDSNCIGTDPNRNFNVRWEADNNSTATHPCSFIYKGPRPFSEPETLALATYLKSITNLRMYLTFHCCAKRVAFPYVRTMKIFVETIFEDFIHFVIIIWKYQAYTTSPPPNYDDLVSFKKENATEIILISRCPNE